MTGSRGLFVRQNGGVGTTPVEARRALGALFVQAAPDAPRSGLVGAPDVVVTGTGGMSYSVVPINPVIHRTTGEGVYDFTFQSTTTVGTDVAPGTDSRWDLIWVKQNDIEKGDADNLPVLGVTKGTPSSSPSKPTSSLPDGALVLAEARIYAGTLATNAAPNTIAQVFPWTAPQGAPVRVRSAADRNLITTPRIGQQVVRLDRDNHVQTYTGQGASGWEYKGPPVRTYLATGAVSNVTDNASRLLASWPSVTKPYARRITLAGTATLTCGAVVSGSKTVYVALSLIQSVVSAAQGRAAFSWTAPGAYLQTQSVRPARDILVGANASPLARLWIEEVTGGSVTTTISVAASLFEFYMDELPEAD